jgi:histidinol-phosphate aminotransferase
VAISVPTFVMSSHFAAANSLRPVLVPALPTGEPDVDALLAADPGLVYLATPNNPTGRAAPNDAVRRLLDRAPGLVMLDEAYTEFLGSSWAEDAARRDNVVVTRTFSKAWGLAGLRVGYGVAAPAVAEEIAKARGPYAVNALAEAAVIAAVEGDRDWLAATVAETRAARSRLTERLAALGFEVSRSDANFVAVSVADAARAAAWLEDRGIAVRAVAGSAGFGDVLRITVGPAPAMDALTAAMAELPR